METHAGVPIDIYYYITIDIYFIDLQYFFDEQDVSRTMESTGLVYSSGGYLRIKFISDLIIHEGTGFSAEFSIGKRCG